MKHSLSVLLSVWAVLHLTSSVSYGEDCLQILMGDTTDYNVTLGDNLEIYCIYQYSNCTNPSYDVSWYKSDLGGHNPVSVTNDSHTNVELKKLSKVETKLLLRFTNIQKSNTGFYQCQSGLTVGHSIKVSVNDNTSFRNETGVTEDGRWMYVYSAAGTVAFVIVIVISVVSMQWCKGHATRETQTETEHLSLANRHAGAKPQDTQTSYGSSIHSKTSSEEEKHPKTRTEKEGSSVMYAALNHRQLLGTPARTRRLKEDSSEYADIRV
ncbi:uncharacterized protein btla [Vanacampus margaritifer]